MSSAKRKVWVTYAWADNEDEDVDFYLGRLQARLDVFFDRRTLAAGATTWEELGKAISDPEKCDAWIGIVSSSALASARWREESFYALDRALYREKFPLIFLVLGEKPRDLPERARIRLYVSITENDWVDKVVAGVEGEAAAFKFKEVPPFKLRAYSSPEGETMLEFQLREGTWPQWYVAVPGGQAHLVRSVTACAPGTPRTFGG